MGVECSMPGGPGPRIAWLRVYPPSGIQGPVPARSSCLSSRCGRAGEVSNGAGGSRRADARPNRVTGVALRRGPGNGDPDGPVQDQLRGSPCEAHRHGGRGEPTRRRCGTRDRRGGQRVRIGTGRVNRATTAPSMRHSWGESRPSRGRLARLSDFRCAATLTLEPGHALVRSTRCFHDDARHLTHAQVRIFRSVAEDLVGGRTTYLKPAADQLDGLAEVVPESAIARATVVADNEVRGSCCRLSH